jgi:catechol 2,3-dioxygenase-like lactoylglutathione lyase family enzyme
VKSPLFDRIDTFILRVADYQKAAEWYRTHLGLTTIYEDAGQRLAVLGLSSGTSLTLWEWVEEEPRPADGNTAAYPIFAASDATGQRNQLAASGVRTSTLSEEPGVRFFTFWDLDGNRLEACEIVAEKIF